MVTIQAILYRCLGMSTILGKHLAWEDGKYTINTINEKKIHSELEGNMC